MLMSGPRSVEQTGGRGKRQGPGKESQQRTEEETGREMTGRIESGKDDRISDRGTKILPEIGPFIAATYIQYMCVGVGTV